LKEHVTTLTLRSTHQVSANELNDYIRSDSLSSSV